MLLEENNSSYAICFEERERGKQAEASKKKLLSFHCGSAVMNPTSVHEDVGLILGLSQWVKDLALP